MTDWRAIADKLASALRNSPCSCVWTGSWPRFKADVKAHPERTCPRCAALAPYDVNIAHEQIVQSPENAARAAKEGKPCS